MTCDYPREKIMIGLFSKRVMFMIEAMKIILTLKNIFNMINFIFLYRKQFLTS